MKTSKECFWRGIKRQDYIFIPETEKYGLIYVVIRKYDAQLVLCITVNSLSANPTKWSDDELFECF